MNMNILPKILMQLANVLMVLMALYVSDTFFHNRDMHLAYVIFSGVVYVGSVLSFVGCIASIMLKSARLDGAFPYDTALIFIAMMGTLVTAVPFLL